VVIRPIKTDAPSTPAEVFPPGEFIDDELTERGCTRADLAQAMGESMEYLDELCAGSKPITIGPARKLAAYFGTSVELWMRLSIAYRRQS